MSKKTTSITIANERGDRTASCLGERRYEVTNHRDRPHLIPSIVAAVFLLGALGRWPYGYYMVLRLVTCASAAFVAFEAHKWQKMGWVWVFAPVALLFNPLVPVHLSRETWQPIDVLVALIFIVAAAALTQGTRGESKGREEQGPRGGPH